MNTTITDPTTWPADIIARYLTVANAHVDINPIEHSTSHSATCHGCKAKQLLTGAGLDGYYTAEYITKKTEQDARHWAQTHASTCRAIPKP
ncbi:hypothetical protein [Streptomyces sp. CB03911]|uniref:hypothetical protein n=1 Tax=Streptomyces sp. CB03911 TaxID=1804758 RepID=UPI000938F72F|nr:hypothetical protein [Streptomyces sp. CB03911]OKI14220.1 hypothetical protein A6A07_13805 [Streptomyces sp. CB03911]